jgi:H+/Cl- antiporter ClcA
MEEQALEVTEKKITKPLIIGPGAVLGAAVGLAGAYMLVKNSEKANEDVEISWPEGMRLGLLILGLLRSISTLHQD